jgi:mannose-1-phosphate guanylyltransferase
MLHAVIMAGGSGTRFWPESRAERPKQLLRLIGHRSMLQTTVDRLGDLVPAERVLVATNARLAAQITAQLPSVAADAILGEPCKRDTAPAIGLAALQLVARDPEATMAVMPSDHVIGIDTDFQNAIRFAVELVEESPGRLVTFGIRPSYPAESFGYIERGEKLAGGAPHAGASAGRVSAERSSASKALAQPAVYRVKRFREKPPAEVAQGYLDSGNFYWNSGIFVWKARTILSAIEQFEPQLFAHLKSIAQARGRVDYGTVLAREFAAIKGVSIDYAVMERAGDAAVVEAPFTWDDVGSWQAISRLEGVDEQGNTVHGRHLGLETTGSILRGEDGHLIVTLGVSDLIVVQTPDATLVANKHDEESIRRLVKLIEERGWQQYL